MKDPTPAARPLQDAPATAARTLREDPERACAPIDVAPPAALADELRARAAALRERAIFLVHYYQPTWIKRLLRECGVEVVVADSQELARKGSESDHELLFCVTVPFMAASSAILAREGQRVVLADPDAGCSLEASARPDLVAALFSRLRALGVDFVPVCYTNVGAEVKALTGAHGGIICTSSSAVSAYRWAAARGGLPVMLPDRHLADNVAAEVGLSRLVTCDPQREDAGLQAADLAGAELLVWPGECNVHVKVDVAVLAAFAAEHPRAHLILHPEVPHAHVRAAIAAAGRERVGLGSTLFIRRKLAALADTEPGAAVGIATESNFVVELAEDFAGKLDVHNLLRNVCACVHMRTRADQLLAALRAAEQDLSRSRHLVRLDATVTAGARKALARSLELKSEPFSLRWR